MSKNDVDECMSDRCCCRLIIKKCNEKPVSSAVLKLRDGRDERAKNSEMSLCDFLKSQPVSDWIKALQDNRVGIKDSDDKRKSPGEPVTARGPVKRVCQQPPSADRVGKQHPQLHHRDIKQNLQVQPPAGVPEDRAMSQIIINIGTIITDRVYKRDSYQQTDPEVRTTVSPSPPADHPTCDCPPVERPTSNYPPAKKSTSICPPVERPTSVCPPVERPTSICPAAEKPTSVCPPVDRPTSVCPPVERPTSNYPPAKKPTSICPPVERPTSVCPPVERPTSICPAAEKPTSVCSPAKRPTAAIAPIVRTPGVESVPVARDRTCRYQGNAPSTVPTMEKKPGLESEIKWKMNCCCTCHSNVCSP
ncbi:repetitive proline-rich cell wall protein-like [Rhopalosiphum maidis]|uniref:repetitive proline-rich cell wall protein-like n=1 Tax=Rhopalosiphum maidis TaxID=43146 RepID=UPI000F00088F|nr:repetitive proline-rich cell wall protein-like [Rhopalosiphum maidis]